MTYFETPSILQAKGYTKKVVTFPSKSPRMTSLDTGRIIKVSALCKLANTGEGDNNTQLNLPKQVLTRVFLFSNVVIREVRIAVLLLSPKETLFDRNK